MASIFLKFTKNTQMGCFIYTVMKWQRFIKFMCSWKVVLAFSHVTVSNMKREVNTPWGVGLKGCDSFTCDCCLCVWSDISLRAIISYCVMREWMRKGLKQIVHPFNFLCMTRAVCGQGFQVLSFTVSFLHWLVEMVIDKHDFSQCCHLFILSMHCCHTTLELCVLWIYDLKHVLVMDSSIF